MSAFPALLDGRTDMPGSFSVTAIESPRMYPKSSLKPSVFPP